MTLIHTDYKTSISFYLEKKEYNELEKFIKSYNIDVVQLVDFIITASNEERKRFFLHILGNHIDVMVSLPDDIKEDIFESFDDPSAFVKIISNLDVEDIKGIIENFEYTIQEEIISLLDDKEKRKTLKEFLSYPEESAGRLIEKDFIAANKDWTVSYTIQNLKNNKHKDGRNHYEIFVLSDKLMPIGKLTMSQLIYAEKDQKLSSIMSTDFHTIGYGLNQEDVANIFKRYSLLTAPVVNNDGKMIGIIYYDEILSVIVEEAEEDLMLLGKVSESDLNASLWETFSRRIPWLFITFCTINIASLIMGLFNETIQKSVEIVILMPIVAAMAGNAGIQASTIALRAVINGTVSHLNSKRLILKEIMVGLCNGFTIALLSSIVILFRFQDFSVLTSFCFSMILVVTIATLMGSAVPLLLNRSGVDPALCSSIFVSSITDILSFFILLTITSIIL